MTTINAIGLLMMLSGAASAGVYAFAFDTSTAVPTQTVLGQTIGGDRVQNLGLLNEQQNGILLAGFWSVVGAVLFTARSSPDVFARAGRVKGGLVCPRCRKISPETALACECGQPLA